MSTVIANATTSEREQVVKPAIGIPACDCLNVIETSRPIPPSSKPMIATGTEARPQIGTQHVTNAMMPSTNEAMPSPLTDRGARAAGYWLPGGKPLMVFLPANLRGEGFPKPTNNLASSIAGVKSCIVRASDSQQ
jgi:hypothetical protein